LTSTLIKRRLVSVAGDFSADWHPVLQRVLAARAVGSAAELDYRLHYLAPFQTLRGMEAAVALLVTALQQAWPIVIVADFDADGATSCAVAVRALRLLGAGRLAYVVPDRIKHGYGLTPAIVEIAAQFKPKLLITVDNGISSLAGVAAAKALGMRVLVTDHHLPGAQLPEADAIVNPNQPGDAFVSKNLAGVGVIFYVMLALRAQLRGLGWFASRPEPNLAQLLDLVALGTVADVVPLDYNNRILVAQGLARIREGHCCAGISALVAVAGREQNRLVASDLAFQLGPRLNAAGRMDNMAYGIDCLLNDDPESANEQARQLQVFNQERKVVEAEMQADALDLLASLALGDESRLPFGLCLYEEYWHPGVVGILASRIKDKYHRPVIVFAGNPEQPGEIKGSARSVPGVHIRDVLDTIAAQQPQLLTRFGGHAMAAGLTLPYAQLEPFKQAFDAQVRRYLDADALQGVLCSDGCLAPTDFNLELAEQLRSLTPWGQGFPEPLFDGQFKLVQQRPVGERHLKLWLTPVTQNEAPVGVPAGTPIETIWFNVPPDVLPLTTPYLHLAYRLAVNVYRGFSSVQLIAEHVQPLLQQPSDFAA